MNQLLNNYLDRIDRYLRPLPAAERADIINEIKSQMGELEALRQLSPQEITQRLGSPRELAGAYLGESLLRSDSFSVRRFLCAILFYSLAGISGMFVLPCTTVLAGSFILLGALTPLSGIIQAGAFVLGREVPWVSFQIGSWTAHPLLAAPLTVLLGFLLILAGKGCWLLTLKYVRIVSQTKRTLLS